MGKTLKKKDLSPEQWATILRTIKREKELEAERKYLVELKKYEDKLRIQQKYKKKKKDDEDIVDEIYKLYFNGMTRKEVLKLKDSDDPALSLRINDKINNINTKILQHQQEVYDAKILEHLELKDDGFYMSDEFTMWADENLESLGELEISEGQAVQWDFDFKDGNWEDGELDHLKEQYSDYLLSLVANDEDTGFLQQNDIWNQCDIYEYQNNPDYVINNKADIGIKIDQNLLPSNESILEVVEAVNDEVVTSRLFSTRIKQLEDESFKLGLNNPLLLEEEFPQLFKNYTTKTEKIQNQMQNTVVPELKNNEVEVEDEFLKQEIESNDEKKKEGVKEFNFNQQTGYFDQTPNLFMKDNSEDFYAGKRHKLGTPTVPSKPVMEVAKVADKPITSPAFASNKTRVDWAKVTGKKWHETA